MKAVLADLLFHVLGGIVWSSVVLGVVLLAARLFGRDLRHPAFYGSSLQFVAVAVLAVLCVVAGFKWDVSEMRALGITLIVMVIMLRVLKLIFARRVVREDGESSGQQGSIGP